MAAAIQLADRLETPDEYRPLAGQLKQHADALLAELGYEDTDVSILLTNNDHIHELNANWRDEDKATDVLSFPLHAPDDVSPDVWSLGDIVISLEYAESLVESGDHDERIAEQLGVDNLDWSLTNEVNFLLIHGLLHLLGHDHLEAEEEEQMKKMETRLWRKINFDV